MSEIVIEFKNVSKKFGEEHIFENLTLSFEKGKIYGLVGRNGSGKTVLLKLISGFLKPDAGIVKVQGITLDKRHEFPENVGILIEKPGFLTYKTGFQTLKYLSSIQRKIDDAAIRNVLEEVGLKDTKGKPVGKYSMGMKQRLGIAQAIMENPEILLLDEPMNGLDNQGVSEIRRLLKKLKKEGKTIVLASHMQEDIQELCDWVYYLDAGKIYPKTPPAKF